MWNKIKNSPEKLCGHYEKLWKEMNTLGSIEERKEYFYKVRSRFNKSRDPADFLFLSRTCVNGLIRYNKKGEFNTSFHFSRSGIDPKKLSKIINEWSYILNKYNVEFICCDYREIVTEVNDFMYLDPPYAGTNGIYFGSIDYDQLWDWLRDQKASYILSFNGKRGNLDNTYNVPKDIYDKHIYITSGRSSFVGFKKNKIEQVMESLYIKIK